MEYNEVQKQIIESDKEHVVVIACAAAGKTRCLSGRINYLLDHGYKPEDIAAITFTNAMAETLKERVKDKSGKIFIGTIHSLANKFLLEYGYNTSDLIENADFDTLFEYVKHYPNCVKHYKYLLLDEAQDSDEKQFSFIFDSIKPQEYMIFADHRQSIYGFKGSEPELVMDLAARPDVFTYELKYNYRNGAKILDFARRIIRKLGFAYVDESISRTPYSSNVIELPYNEDELCNYVRFYGEYKEWFVLCRTNAQVDTIMSKFQSVNIPCVSFKRAELSTEEFNKLMYENSVKVLTIHTSKGLENEYVAVIGANFWSDEEIRISYVAATRAKKKLFWFTQPKKPKKKKMTDWD